MKNFIGGVFKSRQDAERAYGALREKGFEESSIQTLQCTHEPQAVVLDKNPSIKSIGRGALTGALILGGIGAVIGLLVGLGIIRIPGLEPSGGETLPFQITWQLILSAMITGLLFGVWTGGIIGAAVRLAMAPYRKVDTPQSANKGDLMVAVQANEGDRSARARALMKENGAVRFEEFSENWDPEIWSVFDEEASRVH